jgi:hypothetical protein
MGNKGATLPQARMMALIKANPAHPKILDLPSLCITNHAPM